jgi:very-short-patch-repair endonuclease
MKAGKSNLYGYNKNLKGLAKANRNMMTKAEACLWKYVLRARQMKGYQFRRQRPVFNYIADFMCKELKLIIEVDGITHHYPDIQLNDRIRQKELEKAGFTVMRFNDDDVLTGIDWVTLEIEEWICKAQPPPTPPPAGDIETI